MIRILSFCSQASDVLDALDEAAAQCEDMLNRQRGEVVDSSHSLVLVGRQFIVALVVIVEFDDLAA